MDHATAAITGFKDKFIAKSIKEMISCSRLNKMQHDFSKSMVSIRKGFL